MLKISMEYYQKLGKIRDVLEEVDVTFAYNIDEERQLYTYIIYEFLDGEVINNALIINSLENIHYMEFDLNEWIKDKQTELKEVGYNHRLLYFD